MVTERERSALCPAHLWDIPVSATFAAEIADKDVSTIWRACVDRRLPGFRVPAGRGKTHWLIRLGDLVGYTGRELPERYAARIEQEAREAGWL